MIVSYGPLERHRDPKGERSPRQPGTPCLVYVVVGEPTRLVPPFPGRNAFGRGCPNLSLRPRVPQVC
jgi:hypothetical protein